MSWEWIVFGVLLVAAVGGIAYGIIQRRYRKGKSERLKFITFWDPSLVPILVVPDDDVSPSTISMTQRAINWWNDQLGFRAFHDLGHTGDSGLVVPLKIRPAYVEDDHDDAIAFARMSTTNGSISEAAVFVVEENKQKLSWRAMAHELGHVLGLDHDEEPHSVMHGRDRDEHPVLTKVDRELLRSVYGPGD